MRRHINVPPWDIDASFQRGLGEDATTSTTDAGRWEAISARTPRQGRKRKATTTMTTTTRRGPRFNDDDNDDDDDVSTIMVV